jgi:hypothetical protein
MLEETIPIVFGVGQASILCFDSVYQREFSQVKHCPWYHAIYVSVPHLRVTAPAEDTL